MPTYSVQIVSAIIILSAVFALGRIVVAVRKYADEHTMRTRAFWVHTLLPLVLLCILNMYILACGGLLSIATWYDNLRLSVTGPLRLIFPTIVSICTTILGLLVMFAILYPKLSIYPQGAYVTDGHKYWLAFLAKNTGFWEIYGLEAYLNIIEESADNIGHKQIKPVRMDITSSYPILEWRYGHENQNSILIETKNNTINKKKLHEIHAQLELLVKVMHPISRITKVYQQTFALTDIHRGYFQDCRLIRYNPKTKSFITNRLPQETRWIASNILKRIEVWLLLIWSIGIGWYIVTNPGSEHTICMTESGYTIGAITIAIIEITRQLVRCPIESKEVESSI